MHLDLKALLSCAFAMLECSRMRAPSHKPSNVDTFFLKTIGLEPTKCVWHEGLPILRLGYAASLIEPGNKTVRNER
jgi:hypothetical protein